MSKIKTRVGKILDSEETKQKRILYKKKLEKKLAYVTRYNAEEREFRAKVMKAKA